MSGPSKTAIAFHHEKLQDSDEREAMRQHSRDAAERLARLCVA